jgi:hypothetical protein
VRLRSEQRGVGDVALNPPLSWEVEDLPGGVLRMAFAGRGGIGSAGNPDGEQMSNAIQALIAKRAPAALIIDLSVFGYEFGDWIGAVAVRAGRALGRGRVCVLAAGPSSGALRSLWDFAGLDRFVPLVARLSEARAHLSSGGA